MAAWRFLTNHALVLLYLSRWPDSTGAQIAQAVGITERAARRIVDDLQAAGSIAREKVGRRNRYQVAPHQLLERIDARDLSVGQLIELFRAQDPAGLTK